jgi:hypothetical protein
VDQSLFEKVGALSLKFLVFRDRKTVISLTLTVSGKTNFMIKKSSVRRLTLRFLCQ